jgi:hypothetical protein
MDGRKNKNAWAVYPGMSSVCVMHIRAVQPSFGGRSRQGDLKLCVPVSQQVCRFPVMVGFIKDLLLF